MSDHRDERDVGRVLSAALAATPDDFEHPAHDQLSALVDGRLHEADREWVETHLELCRVCAEDVADLAEMRASVRHAGDVAFVPSRPWLKPAIGFGAVAAGLALVVWLGGRRTDPVTPAGQIASAPATPDVPAPAVSPATAEEQALVARALASGRIELPADASLLRGQVGTLLGPGAAAAPLTPAAPVATMVSGARPRFAWTALPNATGYTVAVFDDRFNQVAQSGPLSGLSWSPGSDLPRGRVLAWQVTAHAPGGDVVSPAPPQPEARFVVLSSADAAAVQAQRERLAHDPLALGLVLAKAGLFDEARVSLERALTDARYSADAVRALLQQLR